MENYCKIMKYIIVKYYAIWFSYGIYKQYGRIKLCSKRTKPQYMALWNFIL